MATLTHLLRDHVMAEQTTFAGLAWSSKKKVTRRERFLAEMGAVIPWSRLLARIEPFYPKAGNGRRPLGLEKMLRIYFLQHWFDLSDPSAEEALYDSESMRRFVRIELNEDVIPDETTILNFRHLLEEHKLTEALFQEVNALLEEKGLWVKSGTIVDATIIDAPSSTKNRAKARDPEMKQTRKGKMWYFGMKVHVGTDTQGLVHSLRVTNAGEADLNELGPLLHGEERTIFGDRAYCSNELRQQAEEHGLCWRVNRKAQRNRPLSERWKRINRERSRTRARGEHPFHVVKRLWGFRKVRYRGLAKNEVRAYAAFALTNLFLVRRRLLARRA
jgi:IS5 family transposase